MLEFVGKDDHYCVHDHAPGYPKFIGSLHKERVGGWIYTPRGDASVSLEHMRQVVRFVDSPERTVAR